MDFLLLLSSLMAGVKTTILTFLIVIIVSLPIGLVVTMGAKSSIKSIRYTVMGLIYIVRGTPLLLQLLFIYLGLPFVPYIGQYMVMDRMTAALVGFIFNYSAYFGEIFRGGLLSIDKGQYEAAQVLGLTKFQTLRYVTAPQMLRVVMPSITNESVTLVKDTALLYAVAVPELLHYTKVTVSRTSDPSVFLVAGVIYLIMNSLLTLILTKVEKKLEY